MPLIQSNVVTARTVGEPSSECSDILASSEFLEEGRNIPLVNWIQKSISNTMLMKFSRLKLYCPKSYKSLFYRVKEPTKAVSAVSWRGVVCSGREGNCQNLPCLCKGILGSQPMFYQLLFHIKNLQPFLICH